MPASAMRNALCIAGLGVLLSVASVADAGEVPEVVPHPYEVALACALRDDLECVVRVLSRPTQAREFQLLLVALRRLGDERRYEATRRTYCSRFRCPGDPEDDHTIHLLPFR